MKKGERIYSEKTGRTYIITQAVQNGGQAELAYAVCQGKLFAIKRLIDIRYSERRKIICERFETERLTIYGKLNEQNLPGGSCTYIEDFFRVGVFYYVVTEYIAGIPLCPNNLAQTASLKDRLLLSKIIVYSFRELEKNGIVHGDVKPQNILLKWKDNHLISKLIDFESAFFQTNPPHDDIVGTEPYSAPEVIKKRTVTTKADIFSLGIIIYELLIGYYPKVKFARKNRYVYEMVTEHKDIAFPEFCPTVLKQLVLDMLNEQSEKRPSIMEVLSRLNLINCDVIDNNAVEIIKPEIIVSLLSDNGYKAMVSFVCYNSNVLLYYSLYDGPYKQYITPFIVEDDYVHLKIRIQSITTSISKEFEEDVAIMKPDTKASRPRIKVKGGVVTLICRNAQAKIYYTMDGTVPNKTSREYNIPFEYKGLLKVVAYEQGKLYSDIVTINTNVDISI